MKGGTYKSRGFHTEKITITTVKEMKNQDEWIIMITTYDYPTARLVDGTRAEMILVGDSLASVILGYKDTLPVTVEEIVHHTRAVSRWIEHVIVVGDMPFMSY